MRAVRRWTLRIALALVAIVLLTVLAAWLLMRGSLARLDGNTSLPGLAAPATVTRDALGTVTIDAASEADALRALGFVHAQERYFEMDLMRRVSAGELAALVGPAALDVDRRHRADRLRARVTREMRALPGRDVLRSYVDGVNAGREQLAVRPWPYLLLRQAPRPWRLEDSPLVGYAMYYDLQDASGARELEMARALPLLPPALRALVQRDGSAWDAPLQGAARGDAVLPGPDAIDLRHWAAQASRLPPREPRREVGSNNFAVSGALTRDGRAILADDMHLGLRAPNIWFRARLRYPDARAPGGRVDVTGFTLPGLPGVIVGSNGHVAWGFTNSYGDWVDWIVVPGCTARACPQGRVARERIDVAGGRAATLDVVETRWGPVDRYDGRGN
ncbi:penicillin acylase family protein, partial [Lysobacter xanthus]